MKDVDRLLERAMAIHNSFDFGLFPNNDDGFLDALGVDKTKYEIKHLDGTVGYDFLSALNDTAKEVWGMDAIEELHTNIEDAYQESRVPERYYVEPRLEEPHEHGKSEKTRKIFGWG